MKYLGNHFDIHTGGVDHLSVHHPDEIAQSEAATGEKFVNYWVHTAFMLVQGQKMSKSLENTYRLYDLEKQGYDPIALRYLYLQTHYRQEMNFTFSALDGAQNALKRLRLEIAKWDEPVVIGVGESRTGSLLAGRQVLANSRDDTLMSGGVKEFEDRFLEAVSDDLNTPQALSILWELVKSDYPTSAKAASLFLMDTVLGLNLREGSLALAREIHIVPVEVVALVKEREHLRKNRRFSEADHVRAKIEKLGYVIEDGKNGPKARKK
jgi:cysteinyl-tRNA synthetase